MSTACDNDAQREGFENVTVRRQWLIDACGALKQIFVPEKQDRINWFWYLNPKAGMGRRGDMQAALAPVAAVSSGPSSCFDNEQIRDNHFNCPRCEAEYRIVSIEAPRDIPHGKIACLKCDAMFPAGEGRIFFKILPCGGPSGRFSKRK